MQGRIKEMMEEMTQAAQSSTKIASKAVSVIEEEDESLLGKKRMLSDDEDKQVTKTVPGNVKKFRINTKNLFLTYPNCDMDKSVAMDLLVHKSKSQTPSYVCVARELHKDGTNHLHAYVQYQKKINIVNCNFYNLGKHHGHYLPVKSIKGSHTYVRKGGDFVEFGTFNDVYSAATVLEKRAEKNKLLLEYSVPQLIQEGHIPLAQYKYYREAKTLYCVDSVKAGDFYPRVCLWIYGSSGIGKSRWIKENFPNMHYSKSQNKWWDGYNNEKVVVLEDFDNGGSVLGHHLKIWADDYKFCAEIKGGTIIPSYQLFCITSQYKPSDIWTSSNEATKNDNELVEAIQRRFTLVTISASQLVDFLDGSECDWVTLLKKKKDLFKESALTRNTIPNTEKANEAFDY